MANQVCNTSQLMCSFGAAPSALVVLPLNRVMTSGQPAANIMDHIPMTNIMPFGTCQILTAMAAGVPTPCQPATAAPWAPGSLTVQVANQPALNDTSLCQCALGGVITVTTPGQMTHQVA